jgi:hypothetical protein
MNKIIPYILYQKTQSWEEAKIYTEINFPVERNNVLVRKVSWVVGDLKFMGCFVVFSSRNCFGEIYGYGFYSRFGLLFGLEGFSMGGSKAS